MDDQVKPDPAEDHLLPVLEVNVQAVYRRAKNDARNALLIGRRDINRLSCLNSQLGDNDRAAAEDCIEKLEALMAFLEVTP